jgi:hypothetical protein
MIRRTPESTVGTGSAQMGEEAARWYLGDSKKILALILWRLQLVVYLNYLQQSPARFEANLIRLERAHWK